MTSPRKRSAPSAAKAASPPSPFPKALAPKLEKLGLRSLEDLLLHLPLRYEDQTRLYPIAHAPVGQAVLVEGEITVANVQYRPRRTLVCQVEDASGTLTLRFLHFYPSQLKTLEPGRRLRIFGEPRLGFFGKEMVHPQYKAVGEDEPASKLLARIRAEKVKQSSNSKSSRSKRNG